MSIFITHARRMYENGYSVIPLDGKRPLVKEWSKYCKQMPTEADLDAWEVSFPNANIGLPAGPANGLCFLDVDSYTPAYVAAVRDMIGHSQVSRIGAKGFVVPVRFEGQRLNKLKYRGIELTEMLSEGRQVAAVGIHPGTGKPYQWFGGGPLEMSRDELVAVSIRLPDRALTVIESELGKVEFVLDARDIPVDPETGMAKPGGRNNTLKSQVGAAFSRGKTLEQAVAEVLAYDVKHYDPPLFDDPSEPIPGNTPSERATSFVSSIYNSLTQDRLRSGEALPEVRVVQAVPDDLVERVRVSAEQNSNVRPRMSVEEMRNLGLQWNRDENLANNEYNVIVLLNQFDDHRERFWYDEFYQRIMVRTPSGLREWQDIDDVQILVDLQRRCGWHNLSLSTVRSGVEAHAANNTKNMPRDWLDGLVWDKCPRIEHFFTEAFGSDDTEYIRAVSRNFWVAMVARVYQPGCKFDNMVVLEGHQGARKSSALEVIGGHWFAASGDDFGSKDFLQSLSGKLLVEIPELDSFGKSGIRTIKRVLSNRVDTYRASYGRRAKDYKRQCVFVGTTNEDEYLEDPTGGRRFWPVPVRTVDLDMVRDTRAQCFAEAVTALNGGATWWEVPASAAEQQSDRRRSDAWEGIIQKYLTRNPGDVKLLDVMLDDLGLDMEPARITPNDQKRVGAILRTLGYRHTSDRDENGKKYKIWREVKD